MQTSTRFGVSYPVAARTDPADVAVHIGNVVTGLERAVRYDSGTFAARPTSSVGTPGITGRHYFATDENQMYFDYGTGWIGIMVQNQKQISTLNATAAGSGYASYITGDTQPRFVINADGKHQWGAGGASALDPLATLYRSGAGMLSTDGTMIVNGSLYVSTTAHAIWVQNIQAAFSAFLVKAAADTQQRFRMLGDGTHQWGSGAVAEDVNLYRGGVDILKTDDAFIAAGDVSVLAATADSQPQFKFVRNYAGAGLPGILLGAGGSTALDTTLYRSTVNQLSTGGNFIVGTSLFVISAVRIDQAGTGNKLYFGATDTVTNLYRNAAGELRTDGLFKAGTWLYANVGTANQVVVGYNGVGAGGLAFGSATDTNLYRSAADTLKTDDNFEVVGNLTVTGAISGGGVVPAGAMMQYAGAAAPTGWLIADGAAVSRTTYAALFTAIGTQYGVGDGSTTFNLPNLKGRVPVGLDAANAKFDVRGETGGAETVALSVAELAAHAHAVTDPTHNHTLNNPTHAHSTNGVANGGYNPNAPGTAGVMGSNETGSLIPVNLGLNAANANQTAVGAGTGISIQNNGSGTAHQNLPPYIALNYIIKT